MIVSAALRHMRCVRCCSDNRSLKPVISITQTQSADHVVSERPITRHASFACGKLACDPNSLIVMDLTAVVLFNVELKSYSPSRVVRSVSKDRSRGKNCILPP